MNGMIRNNFTIFGGTGDLTYRKLIPALYNLFVTHKLTSEDRIVAIGRRDYHDEQYHEIIREWVSNYSRVQFNREVFNEFLECITYYKMDFTQFSQFQQLEAFYDKNKIENHIFYYAVAPSYFGVISDGLISLRDCKLGKVIIEKPFGETLKEADEINKRLEQSFGYERIYHIDHYLGKEMVRSIQTLRFTNPIFANSWNSANIENIQIIANEEVGVETRGDYYDKTGALKDMTQNHLLQILTMLAMEKPNDDHDLHQCQMDVLDSLRPIDKMDIKKSMVLGQYVGYVDEEKVSRTSMTETFAACKCFVDNERWLNTPFYIKTGKRMNSREINVVVTFKNTNPEVSANVLAIKIQPLEGVSLKFNIKKPGETEEIIQTEMDFCQSCIPSHRINTPEAYERLLDAVMNNDRTWFSRWDQIFTSWHYIEELKKKYQEENIPVYLYEQGSAGPLEVRQIMEDETHTWGETQLACPR